eukprot:scaffold13956_cov116-Isochrysis_galbana.AAC.4
MKPMLIERLLDQEVKYLSGGELQRVALVMALGKPADLYLIDEPSAYLDSEQRIVAAKVGHCRPAQPGGAIRYGLCAPRAKVPPTEIPTARPRHAHNACARATCASPVEKAVAGRTEAHVPLFLSARCRYTTPAHPPIARRLPPRLSHLMKASPPHRTCT